MSLSFICSFFSHSICLSGSGCGEQTFSTAPYGKRPYLAKPESGSSGEAGPSHSNLQYSGIWKTYVVHLRIVSS